MDGIKKGIKSKEVECHIWDSVTKADQPYCNAISVLLLLHLLHCLRLQLHPEWLRASVFVGRWAPLANSSLEHPQMQAYHSQLYGFVIDYLHSLPFLFELRLHVFSCCSSISLQFLLSCHCLLFFFLYENSLTDCIL